MIEFFRKLFSNDYMPHGMCYLWEPSVMWLNVISDGLIAAAYYAIPFLLFYFARRRRDMGFQWIFVAFGMFILACGSTHLLGAVTVWQPIYRFEGLVKAITAVASVATFVLMIPLMPVLIALPSPAQLSRANAALEQEIAERRAIEAEVRSINEELEDRVARRTAEQRALETQLVQAQKMEAIGRLAGGVAHDFNNLLTVILGYSTIISDKLNADADGEQFAAEITRAANRASALTSQLLAFSRQQVSVPRVLDINEPLRDLQKMLRRIIGEDVRLHINLSGELACIEADPTHIDQIVMNLAVNSRDAMPHGGTLTIETAGAIVNQAAPDVHTGVLPGEYVLLKVSDTGTGMNAETKGRIFEPFFTTKEQGKGTGLGLSIVYGLIKQNNGQVVVDSAPGEGTTFRIYFPVVDKPPASPVPAERKRAANGDGATILLVEDEEQVRTLIRGILERHGYRVVDTDSAGQAVEILRAQGGAVDLMLTDVVMPQANGPELVRQARALRPGLPVLFMSGYTDTSEVTPMLSETTGFIQKPFSAEALVEKLSQIRRR